MKIEPNTYKHKHIYLSSGDGEEYAGCKLNIGFSKWYITIPLPAIIKPHARKVIPTSWDEATIARLGRNYYFDYTERRYGFSLFENHFNVYLGRNSHDSQTEQRWSCFLPWGEWRHVRYSLYDLDGKHFWTQSDRDYPKDFSKYDRQREQEKLVPKAQFLIRDFDGEEIQATTFVSEREWRRGDKWCKWLSLFYKPMIRRDLDISYDKEVGPRKGSWKGGMMGHSIQLLEGESPESAFKRACVKENVEFIGARVDGVASELATEAI